MQGEFLTGIGAEGEKVVRKWLIDSGYLILPASLINQMGAPMLLGKNTKVILPDNLIWRDGKSFWVEVKTKSYATKHESWPKRWEHGLLLRHWAAYELIQQKTQTPVSLAIIELDSKLLLLAPINDLKATERIYPMENELHIFFDRDSNGFQRFEISNLPPPIIPLAIRTKIQGKPPVVKQLGYLQ